MIDFETPEISGFFAKIELDRQQDKIKRARKLIKKKDLLDAHGLLEDVRFSELRIGKFWDDVVTEYQDVDKAIKEDR